MGSPARIALVLCLFVVMSTGSAVSETATPLPNPLAGPGVGEISKSQRKKIDRGWRSRIDGDVEKSRKRMSAVSELPAAQLLELQLRRDEGADVTASLHSFCLAHPDYAVAWVTLSVAAEETEHEALALDAAVRVKKLWPTSSWAARADALHARWVDDRITSARSMVEARELDTAIATLDAALALDPGRHDAALLKARIYLVDDKSSAAEEILVELLEVPEAVYLRGTIAEERGDWQTAMDLYTALPASHPQRVAAIDRARTQWRLTLLPHHAKAAMNSTEVTRGELAVLLTSLLPRLKTLPGGDVPVMSDIVDHPGHREIITVVRLGIMHADRRDHLFLPHAPIGAEAVRDAINRARTILGLPSLRWCRSPDMVGSDCHSISTPPSGGSVVRAVLDTSSGADQ
jgi:tetratricopeptide (TPR) repeat protein